jgi:hypothetical protein
MQIRLLINNVDYTNYLLEKEWSIEETDGEAIDILEVELQDQDNIINIAAGLDIIVQKYSDAGTRYFGGIISNVDYRRDGGLGRLIKIQAQDWKVLLSRTEFSKDFFSKTDIQIIADSFAATDPAMTEITTSGLTSYRDNIPRLTFKSSSLRDMLTQLAQMCGTIWDVTPFKALVWKLPGVSESSADISNDITEVDAGAILTRAATRKLTLGEANQIVFRGMSVFSDDVTDTYSGNGTKTTFNLKIDNLVSGNTYHHIIKEPSGSVRVKIDRNTGSDGVPTWTPQTVGIEGVDDIANVNVLFNPMTQQVIWASAPPNFANNSWRVIGKYVTKLVGTARDEEAIALANGRIFTKVFEDNSINEINTAEDLAVAYLDQYGFTDQINCKINTEGLSVGDVVRITNSRFGLVKAIYVIRSMQTRLIGGTLAEFELTLHRVKNYAKAPNF